MDEIQRPQSSVEGEITLLDILVTLAENIKLLVIGPVLAGLCALGLAFVLPQTYESVAVVQAENFPASLITSAAVLDPITKSMGLAKSDDAVEEARNDLRAQIRAVAGKTDKLLTLTVSAQSAKQAQAVANALLEQAYLQSRPKANARLRLETQLAEARVRLKGAQSAADSMIKRLDSPAVSIAGGAELARGYAETLNASSAAQGQVSALEAQLEGLSPAQLLQAPTLPQKASKPKKVVWAIGAALAAGLLLLGFVFMRQTVRSVARDGQATDKLAKIRRALSLK